MTVTLKVLPAITHVATQEIAPRFVGTNEVQRLFLYAVFWCIARLYVLFMNLDQTDRAHRAHVAIPTSQFSFMSVYGTVHDTNGSSTRRVLSCSNMLRFEAQEGFCAADGHSFQKHAHAAPPPQCFLHDRFLEKTTDGLNDANSKLRSADV